MGGTRIFVAAVSRHLTTSQNKLTTRTLNALSSTTRRASSNSATTTKTSTVASSQVTSQPTNLQAMKTSMGAHMSMPTLEVPNPKPEEVSQWAHGWIKSSHKLQCLLYGVQNPVYKPLWIGTMIAEARKSKEEAGMVENEKQVMGGMEGFEGK